MTPARRLAGLLVLVRMLRAATTGSPAPACEARQPELIAVADELLVMPTLACTLRGRDWVLPPEFEEHARRWRRGNTLRNLRLRSQLTEALAACNRAGIVPLLLKGSLALVDGTLESVGDRMMMDLDLVVPATAVSDAANALVALGYSPPPKAPPPSKHDHPLKRPGTAGTIELHVELGTAQVAAVLPAADAWAHAHPVVVGEAHAVALSPTDQVLNCVLHSALHDANHAVADLPLRQLLEFGRLARVHGAAVDWGEIRMRMVAAGLKRELRSHVWLAHSYTGMALPPGDWGPRPRLRELRVLANFALAWPTRLHRNLRYAFEPSYLDAVYAHGDRPLALALARARHAARALRGDGLDALRQALRTPAARQSGAHAFGAATPIERDFQREYELPPGDIVGERAVGAVDPPPQHLLGDGRLAEAQLSGSQQPVERLG